VVDIGLSDQLTQQQVADILGAVEQGFEILLAN